MSRRRKPVADDDTESLELCEVRAKLSEAEDRNKELQLRITSIERSLKAADHILRPYINRTEPPGGG